MPGTRRHLYGLPPTLATSMCDVLQMEAPLHRGDILSGTVAAIERFGVFVALDDGLGIPPCPVSGSS